MKRFVFTAFLALLAGCSRQSGDVSNPAAASASTQPPAAKATDTAMPLAGRALDTNAAAPELPKIPIEEAFASADEAVKRSCARALIAYQIGDYRGAVQEFESFADRADLSPEQKQLVNDALETTRKMAATTVDASASPRPVPPSAGAPDRGSVSPSPGILDPALQESIARAEIASKIGDYPKAVAELADIVDSPQLTAEQRRTLQRLLAEARKNLPQNTKNAAKPPVKK